MENNKLSPVCETSAADLKLRGFKVYELEETVTEVPAFNRRDFYKVSLLTGHSILHYADRSIEMNGTSLFFSNPHIPYSPEVLSEERSGYACLFTEDFLAVKERSESLQESPLFKIGGNPVFPLNSQQAEFASNIFRRMLEEQTTSYVFKDELIRNYINLIIHEALKMQPSENYHKQKNASSRITSLFLELLERQFPIESQGKPLRLRNAQDFASSLSLHVNHLNKAVREITGKPTTTHIADRVISEAKALLQHTNWSIAEIGYALGFEYPTYFNNYFKRLTGTIPKSFRVQTT